MGHALAGTLWLAAALILAVIALWLGGWTPRGAPVSAALIVAALLGWAGNFIIGMSYCLFPSFVASIRTALQFPALSRARLSSIRPRPFVLLTFNVGLATLAAAFLLRAPVVGRLGGALVLLAALPYSAVTCWTLSFAWRRAQPSR